MLIPRVCHLIYTFAAPANQLTNMSQLDGFFAPYWQDCEQQDMIVGNSGTRSPLTPVHPVVSLCRVHVNDVCDSGGSAHANPAYPA